MGRFFFWGGDGTLADACIKLLVEEILHQLIDRSSRDLRGLIYLGPGFLSSYLNLIIDPLN